MEKTIGNEGHWAQLVAIASEELGIHSFNESGKYTTDVRLVRISTIARALERAYDLGLATGRGRAPNDWTVQPEASRVDA